MRSTAHPRPSRRRAAFLALALAPLGPSIALAVNTTGVTNTYNGSTATNGLTDGSNWSAGVPSSSTGAGAYADLLFTSASTGSVFTGGGGSTNFNAESYNVTNGAAYTLQLNATTAGVFRVGSTSNTGTSEVLLPFTNSVSGVAQDLIYLSNGSSLTFNATNTAGGAASTFVVRQAGNFNIGAGSTLTFNTAISGNVAVTLTGAGTTVLNAASSSTAATNINGGTLRYGLNNALGSGAVNVGGGTLDLQTFNDTVGAVTLSSGSISGSGTLTGTSYSVTGSGSISANLAGTGGLTITSSGGTLTLGGNNTYSGVTYANYGAPGGLLIANSTGALSPNSQYRTTSGAANAGTLQLGVAGNYQMASLQLGSLLAVTGPVSGAATLTFATGGFQTGSNGKIVDAGSNVTVVFGSSVGTGNFDVVGSTASSDRTITFRGAGDTVVNSIIRDNASGGAAAFKGGVDKQGTGTLALNAANTYTLGTTVSAGTLLVNNTTGSGTGTGPVSVTGGTLGGSGFIAGATTVDSGATLAPGGNGAGTLTFQGGLTLNGTYAWEISADSASTGFDTVALTAGGLVLGSSATFQISALPGVDFADSFWAANQSWVVLDNTGSGTVSGSFLGGITGLASNSYGSFSLAYGAGAGGDVTLNWTAAAIPEPASFAALAGLGVLGLAAFRRRGR